MVSLAEEYANQYQVKLKQSMQTNGTLLTQDYIDLLSEHNVRIGLSYDGPKNHLTRGSTDEFMRAMDLLHQNNISFGLIAVISGINVDQADELYHHVNELGHNVQLNHYVHTSKYGNPSLAMSVDQYMSALKSLFHIWIHDIHGTILVDPFTKLIRDLYFKQSSLCSRSSCMRNWLCLNPDGMLSPCDRIFPDEYRYGYVTELDDIRQIYDSSGYRNLISKAIERREKCKKSCDVYHICSGGCNSNALAETGIENMGGFSCRLSKELICFMIQCIDEFQLFESEPRIQNPKLLDYLQGLGKKMQNIKGATGIINRTGAPGAMAKIVDCHDAGFFSNIEEKILPTVRILIENGFLTTSSCEGHLDSCPIRNVSIEDEEHVIRGFQKAIHRIYTGHPSIGAISYFILEHDAAMNLYTGLFSKPKIISINFGDIRESTTELKQRVFEDYIRNVPIVGIGQEGMCQVNVGKDISILKSVKLWVSNADYPQAFTAHF